MKIFFPCLLICLSMTKVAAEDIRIRAGEHESFTRFVFYLPEPAKLDVNKVGKTVHLKAIGEDLSFDISNIFARIPKSRVTDAVRPRAGQLDLNLNCDCVIDTFDAGNNVFVLDVKGARAVAAAMPRLTFASNVVPPGQLSPGAGEVSLGFAPGTSVAQTEGQAVPVVNEREFAPATAEPANAISSIVIKMPRTLPDMTDPDAAARQGRIREAEQRLLEQLARAASQGLLETSGAMSQRSRSGGSGPTQTKEPAKDVEFPKSMPPIIQAETAIDRDLRAAMSASHPVTSDGETCYQGDLLDVTTWSGDGEFNAELGKFRAAIYGERDIVNRTVVRDLARFYIRYGFGAEAIQVLSESPSNSVEWRILRSMAGIVENGYDLSPGPFHGQIDCDTPAALWATLSYKDLSADVTPNVVAILRELSAMPANLRRHLGPILADRFLGAGQHSAAESALRLVERGLESPDLKHQISMAKVDIAKGALSQADETLAEAISMNTPDAPDALIALIDSRLAQDQELLPDTIALAQAFAVELRGQKIAPEIERVAALATAASGQYGEALDRLNSLRESGEVDFYAVRSSIAKMIAKDAGDLAFIALAVRFADDAPTELSASAGNALAKRLSRLGFGDLSLVLVSGPIEGASGAERRIIRARIAINDGRPRRAEAELLGLNGPEAGLLRAEARALGGDHAGASRDFTSLSEDERSIEEAWLAGNWSEVSENGEGIRAETAALILRRSHMETAENLEPSGDLSESESRGLSEIGMLARNQEMISESSSARETLNSLLNEIAVEGDG